MPNIETILPAKYSLNWLLILIFNEHVPIDGLNWSMCYKTLNNELIATKQWINIFKFD